MQPASNSNNENPLAFQVKEFCRRVGISPATFYKYVGLRKIRVIKLGGRTLVPAREVERLLNGAFYPGASIEPPANSASQTKTEAGR